MNNNKIDIELQESLKKALDILTVGILKMLVDKNFISEMEVPL